MDTKLHPCSNSFHVHLRGIRGGGGIRGAMLIGDLDSQADPWPGLPGILEGAYRPDRKILGQADIRVEPENPECNAAQGSIARTAQASHKDAPTLADP